MKRLKRGLSEDRAPKDEKRKKKKARIRAKVAARGKRYSPATRLEILKFSDENSPSAAAAKYLVTVNTIARWCKRRSLGIGEPQPAATSLKLSREEAVLSIWQEHRGYGPSQIRNLLRRNGTKASVSTVRQIMEEHGYFPPKLKRKEHTGRYEAGRPRELYHLDFYHFHVHLQKQCLLFILDDFSRFIVAWTLAEVEAAAPVISCFERAIERHGRPEAVMSDRGSAFHSWRGISRFQSLLEEYEINFLLAQLPQVNGKAEALNATFQKECLLQREFVDLTDAARAIDIWVDHYNHQRPHHGLGGLLVPADRFYGLVERTMRMIEEGHGAHAMDILTPENRNLELFRVTSRSGSPEVYLMGKKILG